MSKLARRLKITNEALWDSSEVRLAILDALEASDALANIDEVSEYSVTDMPERGRVLDALEALDAIVKKRS